MNNNIILEFAISDILLEFAEIAKENITTSDLQGIAGAKAKNIIQIVKRGRK